MRDGRIGLLALQETHLDVGGDDTLNDRFRRLLIHNSPHPDSPTSKAGVAIVINKYTMNWEKSSCDDIIPGRAVLCTLPKKNGEMLHILAVYAPSGNSEENPGDDPDNPLQWLPHVDVLLGDLNIVESALDRIPAKTDDASAARALTAFRERFCLVDGWRLENPSTISYTFRTSKRGTANSRSRIDRIYVTAGLLDSTREWCISTPIIPTDHKMISMMLAPPDTRLLDYLKSRGSTLRKDLDALASTDRSEASNPQVLWAAFKADILAFASKLMKTKASRADRLTEILRRSTMHSTPYTMPAPTA
ncbi:Endonuclease/exonuclease/phosphatase [Ephemerocybe angulata]|uniref:Endonuclease/exonuclease/phosphatase n=1 Tax=Ephemerocybe angulata TaxID=980116 RepID=A0A8H6HIY9_9AGAR|nr:Endonuclease/exonuclease/phosphatase [Tulosesus angulatus]